MFRVSVQEEPFDVAAAQRQLAALTPEVGAIVTFTGQVRHEPLFLEHYPAMAQTALEAHLRKARARWPLLGAIVVHRFGALDVGEPIVLVATASKHRAAAFEAAMFLMDWLKTSAPFWKKEGHGWVEAKAEDDRAARRWLD